jgi:TolB-like protein/thioredoxin-like negative regulator of GroEL
MPALPAPPGDRLDSWKEIAAYLNRGVRTVRRWEDQEGLPVHRQLHRVQGSVYAYRSEIDTWRARGEPRAAARTAVGADAVSAGVAAIAVLPFANLSDDPENAYFADGLTDEVTADLSKVRALRVISRTSSMALKDRARDVKTIARALGVRYVLEGSVRRAGRRLRITAQLIDATTDDHLWADKYDGTVEDVFAFQEQLARVIVAALRLRLSPDEDRRLAERPVSNLRAYECYVRARHEGWRWRKDAIEHAIQLLHRGLELEGENAALLAALGLAHLQLREAGLDFSDRPLADADSFMRRAFALKPASAAGLQLRGWIQYSRGRVQDAVRDLKAALEIDASNADTLGLLSNCYLISGQVPAARPIIARLMAVDPLTPVNRCMPGFADIMEGHFAAALDPYREMFEMDPGNPMARLFYIWVLILNRQTDLVAPLVASFPAEVRETVPARLASFLAHALTGSAAAVRASMTPEVEAAAAASELFPRFLAQGYALAGAPEPAMDWLEIAIARGFINYPFLARHDPFLAPLRTMPRFQQLIARAREAWERFEA